MAKKNRTPEPEAPSTYEILAGLVIGNGDPYSEDMMAGAACEYLDVLAVARAGLPEFVERSNRSWGGLDTFKHERQLRCVLDAYEAAGNEALADDDVLVLVCAYIDAHESGDAADFVEWLFAFFEIEQPDDFEVTPTPRVQARATSFDIDKPPKDAEQTAAPVATAKAKKGKKGDLAGQQQLPLSGTEESPAKGEALRDLTGKRVKYRADDRIISGVVTDGKGQNISFTDDDGEPWSNVSRQRITPLKDRTVAAEPPEEAAAPAGPDVTIEVPKKEARKWQKLLDTEGAFVAEAEEQAPLASYAADLDGSFKIFVEVTNGDNAEVGVYTDIYVSGPKKGGKKPKDREVTFTHPPVQTLAGRYTITVDGVPKVLEVVLA